MIALATWAVCLAIGVLLWREVTSEERPTVRPLTMDERAAWGIYRIQDAAKVARMRSTRAQDRRAWNTRRLDLWGWDDDEAV